MAKRLFLLLFICLTGMIYSSDFLAATDVVDLKRVDDSMAVETVPLPEPEPEPVVEVAYEPVYSEPAYSEPVYSEPAYEEPVYAPTAGVAPSYVNYNVTIATDYIVGTGLSYYDIYRTGKFIYGHNTSNLLGSIIYLNPGDVFTITEGGAVKTYQVTDKIVYEKAENGYLNGSKALTKQVELKANGYDISMMTCYGTMYGNGDASHRLVVFANQI